jgi:NAD(P)-dependent dehydrogenase (short-subunit alcohol dehydrogenase family)
MSNTPRVALVTGANRGIGYAIAGQLAERGIHVITAARSAEQAHDTADHLLDQGFAASGVRLDLTDPATVTTAVDHILDENGRLDVLVNNAGITDGDQQPSAMNFELATRVWQINVLGAWHCANAAIPAMRSAGYGRIVNLSSHLGSLHHMDRATEPAYRVSKAALNALTRVLAAELVGTGILVNSASPGWVRTDLGGPNAPRTTQQGADTPVWLATLPDDGPTGGFFYERSALEW